MSAEPPPTPLTARTPLALAPILKRFREYGIVLSTGVLFIVLSIKSNVFLTRANLLNMADQMAPAGIIACLLVHS